MAKKISELVDASASLSSNDLIPVVDSASGVTKRTTISEMLALVDQKKVLDPFPLYTENYLNPLLIHGPRGSLSGSQNIFPQCQGPTAIPAAGREVLYGFQLWKADRPLRIRGIRMTFRTGTNVAYGALKFHAGIWETRKTLSAGRRRMPYRPINQSYAWSWQTYDTMFLQSGSNDENTMVSVAASSANLHGFAYLFDQPVEIDPRGNPSDREFALMLASECVYPDLTAQTGADVTAMKTTGAADFLCTDVYDHPWHNGTGVTNQMAMRCRTPIASTTASMYQGFEGSSGFLYANDLVVMTSPSGTLHPAAVMAGSGPNGYTPSGSYSAGFVGVRTTLILEPF